MDLSGSGQEPEPGSSENDNETWGIS